ncbi:MAG: DNA-3-methyladenine glycosylase [Bacteroidota bacterium]
MKITKDFYQHKDVVFLAQKMLGKLLCTNIQGVFTIGKIVETEAYCGASDKACHAHLNRRTKRTEIMFGEGGKAYVYLCYGIHSLFNIVTNTTGKADAILVRAIEPVEGITYMLKRRGMQKMEYRLTAGPGVMSKAMGIETSHYGTELNGDLIWLEDNGEDIDDEKVIASPRVGIDYAEEDALLPWRFRIAENKWCSKAK